MLTISKVSPPSVYSVSSPFNWVSRYILFLIKLKRRGRSFSFFGGYKKGGCIVRLPPRALGFHKRRKSLSFVKFKIILLLLCCLLDPLTNKNCRVWSSMINLWIDSRTCQKNRILLPAKQRCNNYLELSKENVLGNMARSH